jgi:hypothetical protein
MWPRASASVVAVVVLAGVVLAQVRDITIVTGKFQSYKDGSLKVKDLRSGDREFNLTADTTVVSMRNTKEKLPLATAFDGVEPGRIVRVYLKGKGDDAKVEAVQIGVGAGGVRPRPGPQPGPLVEDLSKAKSKYVVTADDLFKEYQQDKKAAAAKYANQVVEISGVVMVLDQDYSGRPYVALSAPEKPYQVGTRCYTTDQQPWAKLAPGQKVTLKGRWPPQGSFLWNHVALNNCVVTGVGPNPAIKMSTQQLVKEFLADTGSAKRKYDDKWVILNGKVAGKRRDKNGVLIVDVQGEGDVKLACQFGKELEPLVKRVKAGEDLTVLCRVFISDAGRGALAVSSCLPITEKR